MKTRVKLCLLLLLFLAACGSQGVQSPVNDMVNVAVATNTAIVTSEPPTIAPTATVTPAPTQTDEPTATVEPTEMATATPTVTATVEPTVAPPTPEPDPTIVQLVLLNFYSEAYDLEHVHVQRVAERKLVIDAIEAANSDHLRVNRIDVELEGSRAIMDKYNVVGGATFVLLDAEGHVKHWWHGYASEHVIQTRIDRVFARYEN